MRMCDKCRVDVYGSSPVCPLCQGKLAGAPCPREDIFTVPVADARAAREKRFTTALAVGSAGAGVVCVALNFMVSIGHWWSLFVLGGIASFWLCWFLAKPKKKVIPCGVLWETVVVCLLAVLWDVCTGFHGWSVNYVVPILISFGVLVLFVLQGAGIVKGNSTVFYRFLLGVLGVAPAILLVTKMAMLFVPSAICVAICALSLIHTFGFELSKLAPELKRRLHI